MTRFALRILCFLLLQGLILLVATDWRLTRDRSYPAATLDKHRRAKAAPPPRILLAGGSNVAFGFVSPMLERLLQRPVVNLGLHFGPGLEFQLREALAISRPGDAIVFSPEYGAFGVTPSPLAIRQLTERRLASLAYLSPKSIVPLLDQYGLVIAGGYLRRALYQDAGDIVSETERFRYHRGGFNPWGDYVAHHRSPRRLSDLPPDDHQRSPEVVRPFLPYNHSALENIVSRCRDKKVTVLLTCPPHPRDILEASRTATAANHAILRTIPGLAVLDEPEDQVYALEEFYDTRYHLTLAGAQRRTRLVAQRVQPHLSAP